MSFQYLLKTLWSIRPPKNWIVLILLDCNGYMWYLVRPKIIFWFTFDWWDFCVRRIHITGLLLSACCHWTAGANLIHCLQNVILCLAKEKSQEILFKNFDCTIKFNGTSVSVTVIASLQWQKINTQGQSL